MRKAIGFLSMVVFVGFVSACGNRDHKTLAALAEKESGGKILVPVFVESGNFGSTGRFIVCKDSRLVLVNIFINDSGRMQSLENGIPGATCASPEPEKN